MMYMPDALRAAIELMEADPTKLKHRNAFAIAAMILSPTKIAAGIRRLIPDFTLDFDIDPLRQAIADSWPDSMDDSVARKEWGWQPEYALSAMTREMGDNISRMRDTNK